MGDQYYADQYNAPPLYAEPQYAAPQYAAPQYYEEEYYDDGGFSASSVLKRVIFVVLLMLIIRYLPCFPYSEGMCGGCVNVEKMCNDGNGGGFEVSNTLPSLRGGKEGMYGGAQDYHAGCTPHYAYRNHHDYNIVDYKPAHLINMYPSSHRYVNDI